ncbi:unnamed protein product [Acanthosepion pharaonis]|uniref:VWFA domain-containing protein n=1 Tax=Acanthosepion pharaonis TaxID=158019 RepID=A0A812BXX6_ACAPH|nr:unnamed protein product [Sepia pharaonis]
MIDAVKNIPYVYGSTNTYGGLNVMRTQMFTQQNGDRPSVPNIAILLTDGVSNINAFRTVPEAENARADNIHIYAVGIGLADTTELSQIASPPISDNMFVVDDFQALSSLISFFPSWFPVSLYIAVSHFLLHSLPLPLSLSLSLSLTLSLTVPEAENARADNIHIYAVGIGLADTTELSQIASPPISDNMFVVDDFQALTALEEKILDQFCPVSIAVSTLLLLSIGLLTHESYSSPPLLSLSLSSSNFIKLHKFFIFVISF